VNFALRVLLLAWVLGYLFVSCVPILSGHLIVGGITFLAGVVLFIPWLVGVAILAVFIWLTNPRRLP
jgi:hypothetical protein